MTSRRNFIIALGASSLALPLAAVAQQSPAGIKRIGILLFNSPQVDPIGPLLQGLQDLRYVEGKTIAIDYRFAEGKPERLPELAVELVGLKPDIIFAFGGDVAPHVKKATSTIPIVAMVSTDPVKGGLISSLARPGGNLTGITQVYDELSGKLIQLLKEIVPRISRVAVLWNPDHADPEFRETARTASALGVTVQSLEVRRAADFQGAFDSALEERAEALMIVSSRLLLQQRRQIVEFGTKNRLIMAGNWAAWAEDGLLLTYGPNASEMMGRIAGYVDKVLKGARPADLPMERPTRFELTLNLKAAKALGIEPPNVIVAQADRLIE
jgi:putative tryptophan/tyrosine transport system substrate-binding protein